MTSKYVPLMVAAALYAASSYASGVNKPIPRGLPPAPNSPAQLSLKGGYDSERGAFLGGRAELPVSHQNSIGINAQVSQTDNVEGADVFVAGDVFAKRDFGPVALEGRVGYAGTENFQFPYGGGSVQINLAETEVGDVGLRVAGVFSGDKSKTVDDTIFRSQDKGNVLVTILNDRFNVAGGYEIERTSEDTRHGPVAYLTVPINDDFFAQGRVSYLMGDKDEFRAYAAVGVGQPTVASKPFPYVVASPRPVKTVETVPEPEVRSGRVIQEEEEEEEKPEDKLTGGESGGDGLKYRGMLK
jgi:hypothetical protein